MQVRCGAWLDLVVVVLLLLLRGHRLTDGVHSCNLAFLLNPSLLRSEPRQGAGPDGALPALGHPGSSFRVRGHRGTGAMCKLAVAQPKAAGQFTGHHIGSPTGMCPPCLVPLRCSKPNTLQSVAPQLEAICDALRRP